VWGGGINGGQADCPCYHTWVGEGKIGGGAGMTL